MGLFGYPQLKHSTHSICNCDHNFFVMISGLIEGNLGSCL